MIAPAIIPTAPPTIQWIGADAEPSDAFLDALVALLWNVTDKQAAADGGEDRHGGNEG